MLLRKDKRCPISTRPAKADGTKFAGRILSFPQVGSCLVITLLLEYICGLILLLEFAMSRFSVLLGIAVIALMEMNLPASALPAFARKYKTSCTTCHIGFPKLNAFGESFRNNGYQFPGHMDLEYIKEDQVSLGSDTSFP